MSDFLYFLIWVVSFAPYVAFWVWIARKFRKLHAHIDELEALTRGGQPS
jgi:hypothetical protein